jgi:hypothetical protein
VTVVGGLVFKFFERGYRVSRVHEHDETDQTYREKRP